MERIEYVLERYEPNVDEWWDLSMAFQPKTLSGAIERADALAKQSGFRHRVVAERMVRTVEFETETDNG